MSLQDLLTKSHLKEQIHSFFNPETASSIRRLQIFRVVCVVIVILILIYGTITILFDKSSSQEGSLSRVETGKKPQPTYIETASHKVDSGEMWRYKLEAALSALQKSVQELQKGKERSLSFEEAPLAANSLNGESLEGTSTQPLPQSSENPLIHELQTKVEHLETQLESKLQQQISLPATHSSSFSQNQEVGQDHEGVIQKFSLGLSESPLRGNSKQRKLKTVETTIPAGAFAKTVLLSGLDASASMNASSDPRPMLLRLIDPGTLPRRFQSDLKDCHCTASAYGDLSSERIYARLEKLTCVTRKTGEIIETQVAGYIAGSDGKAGIRGIVASKDGQFLIRSLVGGMFAGLSNVANPQNRKSTVNPFFPGGAQVSPPTIGENFTSGMATGATSALDRLSQYYIDRAEQLQPVIQIAAGQIVDIVFTEGTFIGSQDIKREIEKTRESARSTPQEGSKNDQL